MSRGGMKLYIVLSEGCSECGEGKHILGLFDQKHKALAEAVAKATMYRHYTYVEEIQLNKPWTGYRMQKEVANA